MKLKLPPGIILLIGVIAASTASIFIRNAQENVPSLVIAAYRLGLATIFLIPTVFNTTWKDLVVIRRKQWVLMGGAGIFLALHFASWISSLAYTSVASASILVATTPLWVAIFSPLVLNEHMSKKAAIGLGIAIIGGILVGVGGSCGFSGGTIFCGTGQLMGERALLGDLLALAGALFACGYLLIGRKIRSDVLFSLYIFLVYGGAALVLWSAVFVTGLPITGFPPMSYIWLILLALIPQLIGHSSFNWALRHMPASMVSIALLGEPIGATLLALIFLDEVPMQLELMGGAITLAGIYLASQGSSEGDKTKPAMDESKNESDQ